MSLPVPMTFDIDAEDSHIEWKTWKKNWEYYACATELEEKKMQVVTLLTVLGETCRRVYETFEFEEFEEDKKIKKIITTNIVISKFNDIIEPQTNILFERCMFLRRNQDSEETLTQYITELKIISKKCEFENISPTAILRDRIISGMKDERLRNTLLIQQQLIIGELIKICKTEETTYKQAQTFEKKNDKINGLFKKTKQYKTEYKPNYNKKEEYYNNGNKNDWKMCKYCGRKHERRQCPAYGEKCNEYGNKIIMR